MRRHPKCVRSVDEALAISHPSINRRVHRRAALCVQADEQRLRESRPPDPSGNGLFGRSFPWARRKGVRGFSRTCCSMAPEDRLQEGSWVELYPDVSSQPHKDGDWPPRTITSFTSEGLSEVSRRGKMALSRLQRPGFSILCEQMK